MNRLSNTYGYLKTITYSILKVDKTFLIVQIKLTRLDGKIVDCVFIGYPRGIKGYELIGVKYGGSKFINYISNSFNESRQGKNNKDARMELLETMAKKTRFEVLWFEAEGFQNSKT